jgi:Ca2+-binding EF-hand superfamily protein
MENLQFVLGDPK